MKNKFSFEVIPSDSKAGHFYFVIRNVQRRIIYDSRTVTDRRFHVGKSYSSKFDAYMRAWSIRDRLERRETT